MSSIVTLLTPHFKHECEFTDDPHRADLALLCLDGRPIPDVPETMAVVGCAPKPRLTRGASIHFPPRAYEVLALVNEQPEKRAEPIDGVSGDYSSQRRCRLRRWPVSLESWPKDRLQVLAALSRRWLTCHQLAALTNTAPEVVKAVVSHLDGIGYVLWQEAPQREVLTAPRRNTYWQSLVSRVGAALGLT